MENNNLEMQIQETLKEPTEKAIAAADAFCTALEAFEQIDLGEVTDENRKEVSATIMEADRRRAMILRRVMLQYGNLLFL